MIFGIINGLMIRPLAGAEAPGEVVGVFSKDRTAARDYRPFSYPGFRDVRGAGGPFAHLAAHTVSLAGVTENNITRPVTVDLVTTGFFETLGVKPAYGRDFTIEEEHPGTTARSVIVSYKVWGAIGARSRHPDADRPHQWAGLRHCRRGPATFHRHHSHPGGRVLPAGRRARCDRKRL